MKSQNPALLSVKFVAKDVIGDVLYWPVWWYSRGLVYFIKKRLHSLKSFEEDIGLTVWIVNWGKPMYGQYDLAGKLMSFFFRTLGILWKILQLMFYFVIEVILLILWLFLPILIVWQLVKHLFL